MFKFMKSRFIILPMLLLFGCNSTENTQQKPSSESSSEEAMKVEGSDVESQKEQTNDERILEIKKFYKEIESSEKKACNQKTMTSYDSFDGEEQIAFENTAEICNLAIGFTRKSVELFGYEWAETCTFYYEGDNLFFAYLSGGAEACAYEYRVYYDRNGKVIRLLASENDCDGEEPGESVEVTDLKKSEDILSTVNYDLEQLESILAH